MALDKLEVMKAFCRIIETGNFKNASESLQIAPTTLSGQIQALEQQLGITLLHRTTRKVSPTADGQRYYERIVPLLSELDEINQEIQQAEHISGLLKIELPSPVADDLIVPNLPDFLSKYPNLRLEIGSSERMVDLAAESVDCAIRGGVVGDEHLVSKIIGQMPFCLCATPDYLARHRPIRSHQDLAEHDYLAFKFATSNKIAVPLLDFKRNPAWKDIILFPQLPKQIYNNAQTYYQAMLAGLGISYAPKSIVMPHIERGRLQEILPDYPLLAMPLSFVYPYSRHTPKRVKVFLQWVEQLIAENPLWR